MTVFNLGSINIDHVYKVPHLPEPGETLAATAYSRGLGGKGANQSVAAARAGAKVRHIGAIGEADDWALHELAGYGVGISGIARLPEPTGHAIINVDPSAENAIVLFPGANASITDKIVKGGLTGGGPGDFLMLQNETSHQVEAAKLAAEKGLGIVYSAAPFDPDAVRQILSFVTLLAMNEGEAEALRQALGEMPKVDMVITRGAKGAEWISAETEPLLMRAFPVEPVDTTGAGDCFIGTLVAGLDLGMPRRTAMRRASAAAALQVTRPGAAQAMPGADEVDEFLSANG